MEPWKDLSPVLLLTGSAGGGKSKLAAEKIHGYCKRYPGTTAVILRKTRESLLNATLLFFERSVVGSDPSVGYVPSKHRFEYSNGSILAIGGMKDDTQREQLRGVGQEGGLDIAWMEEATHFDESDYNEVSARMRGRAASWRQIILTCNPDAPTHWIYSRLILGGEASTYYSAAKDNPYNPEDYVTGALAKLTGVEKLRLGEGKWVQASGMVYDAWSDTPDWKGNVTPEAEYVPGGGEVYWAADDGYSGKVDENTHLFTPNSHPRVFLFFQKRPTGELVLFDESYAVKLLPEVHLEKVLASGKPHPEFIVVDKSAASLRARISAEGLPVRSGPADVEESIKEMRRWVAPDENGRRMLLVHPRCKFFRSEMVSYAREDDTGKIVKAFDHGPDAARYLTWCFRYE